MKFITRNLKYRFKDRLDETRDVEDKFNRWFKPDNRENKWAQDFIYGIETNFNLGTATKVNMILHGDGSTNIFVKDGLLPFKFYDKQTAPNFLKQYDMDKQYFDKEVNGQFDLIVTNPPFSVTLDNETKEHLANEFVFGDKKNSENLFVERWYQLLKPNGRFGVVLPESVLDRKTEIGEELLKKKATDNLDLIFFAVVDILKSKSDLFVISEDEKEVAQKAFGAKEADDLVELPGVVSRKKQIVPPLEKFLSGQA